MTALSFDNYLKHAHFSELCGHRIAHWRSPSFNENRDTILMLHGFPSASWDWHFLWKHLANRYQLLSLDLLGFGLSAKPKSHHYRLVEQADIVQALLQQHDITHCHILAHDYGNSVAQELLSRQQIHTHQSEILSVCFLNGGLFASQHRPIFTQRLLKSPLGPFFSRFMNKTSLRKGFEKIFAPDSQPDPFAIEVLWQLIIHNGGNIILPKLLSYIDERKVHDKRWTDAMIRTLIPLYFINGVKDPISGQHMLDHYIETIPTPRTCPLPVGHYPQLEAPQQVLSSYSAFLQEIRS